MVWQCIPFLSILTLKPVGVKADFLHPFPLLHVSVTALSLSRSARELFARVRNRQDETITRDQLLANAGRNVEAVLKKKERTEHNSNLFLNSSLTYICLTGKFELMLPWLWYLKENGTVNKIFVTIYFSKELVVRYLIMPYQLDWLFRF
jgi:hypothetical protein